MNMLAQFGENQKTIEIDGAVIRQDQHGRYCLNDLHKASGSERKNQPQYFLENKQTQDLAQALTDTGIPVSPINVIRGGLEQGTYVVKQIVYAYAMWISAAFNLKVINTFDAVVTQKHIPDLNNPNQLRELLLGYAEQNIQLAAENKTLSAAIENITATENGVKFQQACKILNVKQADLAKWLRDKGWDRYINKSRASTHYSQERGYCETKFEEVDGVKPSGEPYNYTKIEFFILPKGMAVLAKHFGGAA
ncbi:KilA-N domain-containing protein [Acinetobacter pseudolwoffii]|uniref:KilA-N domain-containing protein n=1 Tax=Acinetobacter pseudolwoffii TaxID=2053287 RepID=UPI00207B6C08|nr:KilA-N domain-containing protein [Acinetobacter pseudolwoffii]